MRSRHLILLSWIGLFAACAQDGAAGNTEITLTFGDDLGATEGVPAFEADRVDYRVTCQGTDPASLPIPPDGSGQPPTYDDSVDISGSFEIIDGNDPPIWYTLVDLPPGDCTVSLSVYRENALACLGGHDFTVVEDGTTGVSITLLCELSVGLPDGGGDVEGDFSLQVGNECPKLFDLTAHPNVIPAGQSTALLNVVAQDVDGTCGARCDPQTCDDGNPPFCTPGPDLGLTTTFSAIRGSFDDPNAALATYTCDPAFPGPIQVCATASDGDLECDKTSCIAVVCPDPCEGIVCNDGNECTYDYCDPNLGQCVYDPAPDGIACNDCNNTCSFGSCVGPDWVGQQQGTDMPFVGDFVSVDETYVNPYSGFTHVVPNSFVLFNNTTYEGVSAFDTINGTPSGDYILLSDPLVAPQTVCGVERFFAGPSGDFAHFADLYIRLGAVRLIGLDANDVLWGNWGNDFLQGGLGNDVLDGGPGVNAIQGEAGDDHVTMAVLNSFNSVLGGAEVTEDQMSVNALASQITILPAVNSSIGYEFDLFYLSKWIAQIGGIERLNTLDTSIDLTACVAGVCPLCGDGVLNGGEECDDGNNGDGDGCSSSCLAE